MRNDLLALTTDDLTLLANRGLVKRAQAELQAGELLYTITEDQQGNLTIGWSDSVECLIPAGKSVAYARCSCPATTICRHLLRSVLAYQQFAAQDAPAQPPQPWDPGAIDDAALALACASEALVWARKTHAAGQVIELVRSSKPSTYLHGFGIAVRFLVPDDLRYTHCDCAEPSPCRHVPLAVLAFRQLDPNATSGIIETAIVPVPIPSDLLDDLEHDLSELTELGLSNAPSALFVRLRRIEQRCRDAGLHWPADALAELTQQHDAYAAHDARFDPGTLAHLIGELCVRSDAIRSNTGAVPQLFVRGSQQDAETRLGATRLVGLGCSVQLRRGGAELTAYQQDINSGALSVVRRTITDPTDPTSQPLSWRQHAQTPVIKDITLAAFASGQVLLKGGRRLANGELKLGRSPVSATPQAYTWETLRAPLLAETISELGARLAAQPPAALRHRRLAGRLAVCAVAAVEAAAFVPQEQAIRAQLRDTDGERLLLHHPYTSRGHHGVEALLAALQRHPNDVRFVAGHVTRSTHGPQIAPTAVVFQDGAMRFAVLPWIAPPDTEREGIAAPTAESSAAHDPLSAYWSQIHTALGDLLVVGLRRADSQAVQRWQELARFGEALGFGRSITPIKALAEALENKLHTLAWSSASSAAHTLALARTCLLIGDALG